MEGTINIIGLIGDCGDNEQGIELVDVVSQVRSQPQATSFRVIINSEGGNVDTGEDIYKYLKSLQMPITTIGTGMVASIATVIFMAGSKRMVKEGTRFMIHFPMGNSGWLTADELADYSKFVKQIENRMVDFYSTHTGMQKEAIEPMLRNETFLTPEQLLSLGFTTEREPLKVAARASININKNQGIMSKQTETILQRILNAIEGSKKDKGKKKKVVNLILLNAEQTEVDFYELDADDEVSVGAKARIDGADATGEIVMADGRTFVFGTEETAGELIEIKEVETDEAAQADDEEVTELLVEVLEIVQELAEEVHEVKEELSGEIARLKTDIAAKDKIIAKIKALQSKFEDGDEDKKDKKGGKSATEKNKSRFKKAMANIKPKK